jgi:hypothetical protein
VTSPPCSRLTTVGKRDPANDELGRIASVLKTASFSGDMQHPRNCSEGCALELFVARYHSIFVKPCCKREGALALLLLGRSFDGGESELVGFDWDRK